jgi:hypothetical protein
MLAGLPQERPTTGGKTYDNAQYQAFLNSTQKEISLKQYLENCSEHSSRGSSRCSDDDDDDEVYYLYVVLRKHWSEYEVEDKEYISWIKVGDKPYYDTLVEANNAAKEELYVKREGIGIYDCPQGLSQVTIDSSNDGMVYQSWKNLKDGITTEIKVDRQIYHKHKSGNPKPMRKHHFLPKILYEIKILERYTIHGSQEGEIDADEDVECMHDGKDIYTLLDMANLDAARKFHQWGKERSMRIDDVLNDEKYEAELEELFEYARSLGGKEKFKKEKRMYTNEGAKEVKVFIEEKFLKGPRN